VLAIAVTLLWGEGAPEAALCVRDPRDEALGWRCYGAPALEGAQPATRADYDALRVACAVPQSGVELIPADLTDAEKAVITGAWADRDVQDQLGLLRTWFGDGGK